MTISRREFNQRTREVHALLDSRDKQIYLIYLQYVLSALNALDDALHESITEALIIEERSGRKSSLQEEGASFSEHFCAFRFQIQTHVNKIYDEFCADADAGADDKYDE